MVLVQLILNLFEINFDMRIRTSNELNVSKFHKWRTLKANNLHPYHCQPVQVLQRGDAERRMNFCRWS